MEGQTTPFRPTQILKVWVDKLFMLLLLRDFSKSSQHMILYTLHFVLYRLHLVLSTSHLVLNKLQLVVYKLHLALSKLRLVPSSLQMVAAYSNKT